MNWNRNPALLRWAGRTNASAPTQAWYWRRETNYVGRLSLSVAFAGCKLSLVIA
jgi:hypothetical protein